MYISVQHVSLRHVKVNSITCSSPCILFMPAKQFVNPQKLYILSLYLTGDFAYNFETVCKLFAIQINFIMTMLKDEGKVGDDFMNEIQDIATQIPYMTTPGNHEEA